MKTGIAKRQFGVAKRTPKSSCMLCESKFYLSSHDEIKRRQGRHLQYGTCITGYITKC
jgi:hypothetical protein